MANRQQHGAREQKKPKKSKAKDAPAPNIWAAVEKIRPASAPVRK